MTSTLLQKSGLKVFEQHMRQYEPADPVYETYTDKKGKQRRRRVRVLLEAFVTSSQQTDFHLYFLNHYSARAPSRPLRKRPKDPKARSEARAPA